MLELLSLFLNEFLEINLYMVLRGKLNSNHKSRDITNEDIEKHESKSESLSVITFVDLLSLFDSPLYILRNPSHVTPQILASLIVYKLFLKSPGVSLSSSTFLTSIVLFQQQGVIYSWT